jgi:hypothetical protein
LRRFTVFSHCHRYVMGLVMLCAFLALGACAVAPAPKVQCDAKLRPINTGDASHE